MLVGALSHIPLTRRGVSACGMRHLESRSGPANRLFIVGPPNRKFAIQSYTARRAGIEPDRGAVWGRSLTDLSHVD